MTKFFRKYSKALLVGFGVVLMVAFLAPQAIQQFGQQGADTVVMRIGGRPVKHRETTEAATQAETVQRISGGMLPASSGIDPRGDHWHFAREYAKAAGFVGGPASGLPLTRDIAVAAVESEYVRQFAPQLGVAFARQLARGQLGTEEARKRIEDLAAGLSREVNAAGPAARAALAAARGIAQMRLDYQTLPRLSEPRLTGEARRLLDAAEVSVVFAGVDNKLSTALTARDEAALIEHFERYKDKRAGTESPFGYQLPARVKLEWIVLDRAAMERAVRPDPVEVQKRIVAGASAGTADAGKRRVEVEAALRRELTDRVMAEATLVVKSEILKGNSRLAERGAYKALPENWATIMPRMAAIAPGVPGRVQERTGTLIPEPGVFVREAQWLTVETEVAQLPGIAQASMRVSGRPVPFAQVVAVVRELRDDDGAALAVHPQAGVPWAEPLDDALGNRYFCTVLAAAKSSPPASIDEVRERVVADKKKADAFETLKGDLSAYRLVAAEQGLEAVAEQFRALTGGPAEVKTGVRVQREAGVQPADAIVNAPEFIEAVMDAAARLDPTKDLAEADKGDLIVAVALPGKLGVAVAQITEYSPLTREDFRRVARAVERSVATREVLATPDETFSRDWLIKRLGVSYVGQLVEGAEQATPAAAAKPDARAADKGAQAPAPK